MALRALAGDGQLAKPRPWRVSWRGLKGYQDVLGVFGGDGVHSFDSKIWSVHLRVNKAKVKIVVDKNIMDE